MLFLGMGSTRRPGGTPRGGSGGADTETASGGPALPRRSARIAPAPTQETRPCSDRQRRGEARRRRRIEASDASASESDSDCNGNASTSSSSKRRKRDDSTSDSQRFEMLQEGADAADVVVASPDSVGKENTSSGHAADSNVSKPCEGSGLIGTNKRHSSDVECNVSKRLAFGLHEAPAIVARQWSTPFSEAGSMFSTACTTLSPPPQQLNDTQQKEGVKKLMNTPENLHVQLKQELSKLIKVLQLPDNVRFMADQLFEYVLNNHQVVTKPVGILHVFNIALCWRAASLLNCKVDRRESLALAEKSLNFECNEDLVALIYRKLRTLKEKIPYRAGETCMKGQPVSVEDIRLSWQETSTNLENDHMFQNKETNLHGKFTNGASQEISTVAEQIISERQEPVQETRRECHVQNDEIPSMIVEKSIDLVGNVFSLREKNILCKQQLEISGLVAHRQNNVIRLKKVCSLVLEHIRRSHIDEMTRREKTKLTVHWFTMLMYAFLEHMKLQHEKLEGLQSYTWSSERQLKENLHQVAKSGQLDQDFDKRIALPDSNFVMEEFIHFKEQNDEHHIFESCLSHCQQSSNATLLMEITLVRNEVLSEPICIQAMEDEPVETSLGSRGELASEAVDFSENSISCSSDGIGVQSAGCSSSTVPSDDESIGQEASTGECRNTEHIKMDNIAKPSMLLGGATSLVSKVNSNNGDTLDTEGNHLEPPILASSQSFQSLVGTRAVVPCMSPHQSTDLSAQQNVAPSRCPPVEAEQTALLDLATQAEMQPSILSSDAPLQKMPNDRSQTGVQPDRAIELSQGAATASLHLGDARMQGQGKNDGNVAVDPVLSESPFYPADSPVTLQGCTEVETQTCESSMPAKQSTSPPAQQSLAISRHPPAEVESSGILGTEAAWDLQPESQPSISMQHQPEEAEQAGTLVSIAAQYLEPEMQSSTSMQNVSFQRSYLSGMPVLQSLTVLQSVGPSLDPHAGIVIAHDQQTETQPSTSELAEQSTSLPAQQSLTTSQHSPAEAEPAGIIGTEAACDLQPEVQPSTSMQDEPAEAERAASLGAIAAQALQPEMQSSTSTQDVPVERTYLSGMPVLQSPNIHQIVEPSLDPHAGAEPVGMVTAQDPQSEILPSAPVPAEQSTSLLAGQSLATLQHSPAEAELADILGTGPPCDLQPSLGEVHDQPAEEQSCILSAIAGRNLQPETQPPTSTQSAPFERTHLFVMPVLQSLTVNHGVEPSLDPGARAESAHVLQPEVQPLASMQDRPAEAEGAVMLGSMAAQDLQAELQSSTTLQHAPLERICPEERRQTSFQPNMVPGLEQPSQRSPVTSVSNNPILSDDMLKNELHTLRHCNSLLSKDHEHKKALLLIERDQEIEKIKEKYASLLRKEDSTYLQTHRDLADIYRKVVAQDSLAENFRREMTPSVAAQGRSTRPAMEQPESSSAAETAASQVISSSAIRLPHSSSGSAGAQPRASGRLVQQLRMPRRHPVHRDQQQLPTASPGVAPLGQHAPIIMESSAQRVPRGGAVLNCMDPSSAHQSVLPAPESQQHAGAQIAGGSKSASLSTYLPARLGLGSSSPAAGTGLSAEVVCLSDDES